MGKFQDLTGKRFGKLVALEPQKREGQRSYYWLCKCDCGNNTIVLTNRLVSGKTKSCSCKKFEVGKEGAKYYHKNYVRLYSIWAKLRSRCERKNDNAYQNYGGRGISVCEEWHSFENFMNWAIANGYSDKLTIDRIDNNGNYEPSNCRWADRMQQANNTRANRLLTYNGKTMTLSEWARELGIYNSTLYRRLDAHADNLDMIFFKGDKRYGKRN